MRFAWLQENSADYEAIKQGCAHPLSLIRVSYNVVFWVFLLPFVTKIDYSTGFIAFTIVIFGRLVLNLYTNHVITQPEQYQSFPFRIP